MRGNLTEDCQGAPFTGLVTVRHHPDPSQRLHKRDNERGLPFGAVRSHCRHRMRQAVLKQPPHRGESLDDNQIVKRRLEPKAVVQKQRLSEFKDFAVPLPFAGEAVTGIVLCDSIALIIFLVSAPVAFSFLFRDYSRDFDK